MSGDVIFIWVIKPTYKHLPFMRSELKKKASVGLSSDDKKLIGMSSPTKTMILLPF